MRIRKVVPHPTESSWLISTSHGNNEVSIWNIETSHRQAALWASNTPPLSKEISVRSLTLASTNVAFMFPFKQICLVFFRFLQKNASSVCGVVAGVIDRSPFLFTGGSDQRIRYWNLSSRENCSMTVPANRDYATGTNFSYEWALKLFDSYFSNPRTLYCSPDAHTKISVFLSFSSRLIDGTRVIYEVQMGNKSSAGGAATKADDYSPRSGPEMPLPCHNDVVTDLLLCKTQKYPVLVSSSRDGVIKLWK